MRVLHVIPGIGIRDGGPSRAIRAMASGLRDRGIDVTVATTHSVHGEMDAADLTVPLVSFARQFAPGWKLSLPLAQWLWRHAAEFDLLHLHSTFCYTTLAAAAIARAQGLPYIIRPLGTLEPWSLRQKAWRKRPYYALVERGNLSHASALHATSESEAGHLRRLRLAAPVTVVPLGFELPPAPQRRLVQPPLRLLFLSRLHPKKNLPALLEAVARLRRERMAVTLTIAGDGPAEYRAHLQRLAVQLGLRDDVVFTGWVDGPEKSALLAQAHLFVLPSLQENFGIAVVEALAAGLPVVLTTEVALAAEVTLAEAGASVPSSDPDTLAQAIRELSRPERYVAAARNAQQLARTHFSLDRMTDGLLSLYHKVLCSSRNGVTRSRIAAHR